MRAGATSRFRLVGSVIVVAEARRGESEMSRRRLEVLSELPILHLTDAVAPLAERLVGKGLVPAKALQDAFHISLAACHDVDLLVTWNFKHIANPATRAGIASFLTNEGYRPPLLCSPLELMESANEH